MTRHIQHAAAFCALLLVALLVNAARVQIVQAPEYDDNPANRRPDIARYQQPLGGDILVGGEPVTGSRDTGEHLRFERTYQAGPLYARDQTGFASQAHGTSLLEHAEDGLLSGADPMLRAASPLERRHGGPEPGRGRGDDDRRGRAAAAFEGSAGTKGAVAAVEPSTGRILALVSTPSYDPPAALREQHGRHPDLGPAERRPGQADAEPGRAPDLPPGSTFKVVTTAAALDAGVIRDLDAPTRSPDPYTLPGTRTRLTNAADGCRDASLREAFEWSCNTVFAKLGVDVGVRDMAATAEAFGFNDAGLRIPFAVSRSTFDASVDRAQLGLSSIGQYNTRATPLQMAMVAAAVANGGQVRSPYLVERTMRAGGSLVATAGSRPTREAMRPSTAARLEELMTGVVEKGTGANAAIRGATVGGKTGTAQHGVGNSGTPYAWFVSWAQGDGDLEPKVAVAVVVEGSAADREDISGGGMAAPIARAVMEAVLES
ncbi:penicillin-binding protein 2 [Streptomyces thinghirensis]|nr:penicillin-binding protein 2 [Streptomyces thinghirensis]